MKIQGRRNIKISRSSLWCKKTGKLLEPPEFLCYTKINSYVNASFFSVKSSRNKSFVLSHFPDYTVQFLPTSMLISIEISFRLCLTLTTQAQKNVEIFNRILIGIGQKSGKRLVSPSRKLNPRTKANNHAGRE